MARSKRHTKSGPGATVDGVNEVREYSPEIVGATLTVLTGGQAGRFYTVDKAGAVLGDHRRRRPQPVHDTSR